MKWITKDIDIYLQSKEYVDTAVIPLFPNSWIDQVKSTVALGEYITVLANEVERQFKGRIILFPPFTYAGSEEVSSRLSRLQHWSEDVKKGGIKHIVYLTSDSEWKQVEQEVSGSLIWFPTLPLEYVDENYKQKIIQDQTKQLISLFMDTWQQTK